MAVPLFITELINSFVNHDLVFLGTIKPAESSINVSAKRVLFREVVADHRVVTVQAKPHTFSIFAVVVHVI